MAVMMQNRWKAQYLKKKNIQVDYDSTGTTVGVDKMIEKQLAIAFTHAPISSEKQSKARSVGGEVVQVPIVICGVVPIYNLPELKGKKPVNFTGEVLANIFLGNIKTWDHQDLKAINTDLTLPPTPITVVHREDSSGTTLIFTDYLSKASAKWRDKFPRGDSKIEWPVGVGAERNMNLSIQVSETKGAIGYVDLLYTHLNKGLEFEYGAVQNHDKTTFLRADADNMTAAAREAISGMQGELMLEIADKPGPKSYPISGVIYAICYRNQSAEAREMVFDFLHWATHEGQEFTEKMNYAPLPAELIPQVDKQLKLHESTP
jgi:phosphate transport system substrate-binding protein